MDHTEALHERLTGILGVSSPHVPFLPNWPLVSAFVLAVGVWLSAVSVEGRTWIVAVAGWDSEERVSAGVYADKCNGIDSLAHTIADAADVAINTFPGPVLVYGVYKLPYEIFDAEYAYVESRVRRNLLDFLRTDHVILLGYSHGASMVLRALNGLQMSAQRLTPDQLARLRVITIDRINFGFMLSPAPDPDESGVPAGVAALNIRQTRSRPGGGPVAGAQNIEASEAIEVENLAWRLLDPGRLVCSPQRYPNVLRVADLDNLHGYMQYSPLVVQHIFEWLKIAPSYSGGLWKVQFEGSVVLGSNADPRQPIPREHLPARPEYFMVYEGVRMLDGVGKLLFTSSGEGPEQNSVRFMRVNDNAEFIVANLTSTYAPKCIKVMATRAGFLGSQDFFQAKVGPGQGSYDTCVQGYAFSRPVDGTLSAYRLPKDEIERLGPFFRSLLPR